MRIRVLGSAAGGGFPQWNCNSPRCVEARNGRLTSERRTQSSIAVSGDDRHWLLVNASPDIRQQIMDNPPLAERFRDLICRSMLERARVLDEEAGWDPSCDWGRGFNFMDDNCALLTPDMYAFFGKPILRAVFDRYAPNPNDRRFQHSDSAMGHLLPHLGELELTEVNFGPTVMVREIREHLPRAIIDGVLAPFTFSRHDEVGMVRELLRDHKQAAETGRGLVFATAGSINNGSRLTGMRLLMAAIQRHGGYAAGA